ncbi:MAG: hypothetical protein JWM63_249 [Gammaproteobacteria bacterium]|nr:hypothetical protein [Gammaproteobacteria bacterium]
MIKNPHRSRALRQLVQCCDDLLDGLRAEKRALGAKYVRAAVYGFVIWLVRLRRACCAASLTIMQQVRCRLEKVCLRLIDRLDPAARKAQEHLLDQVLDFGLSPDALFEKAHERGPKLARQGRNGGRLVGRTTQGDAGSICACW